MDLRCINPCKSGDGSYLQKYDLPTQYFKTVFVFKTFGNWLSFPKKVVSTDQLKTRIKSEQNNFGTIFCLQFIRDSDGIL